MSNPFSMYKDTIKSLAEALEKEEILTEDTRPVAIMSVVTEAYGMGDVYAGMLLRSLGRHDTTKEIAEIYGYEKRVREPMHFLFFIEHIWKSKKSKVLEKFMKGGGVEE